MDCTFFCYVLNCRCLIRSNIKDRHVYKCCVSLNIRDLLFRYVEVIFRVGIVGAFPSLVFIFPVHFLGCCWLSLVKCDVIEIEFEV